MDTKNAQPDSKIYFIVFEEYLQPKQTRKLQSFVENKSNKIQKLPLQTIGLENHVPNIQSYASKPWKTYLERFKQKNLYGKSSKIEKFQNTLKADKNKIQRKFLRFLSFSNSQPNDDGICRRKTDFEIYCEMASIHGFINFIDARLWQRLFWTFIIGLAICMTIAVITVSFVLSLQKPTVFYTEGITDPTWPIPFPAVTICNLNRISEREALRVADKFLPQSSLSRQEIVRLFRLTLYATQDVNATNKDLIALEILLKSNNYTIANLLREISPKCSSEEYKLCKWKGHHERCQRLLDEVLTPLGVCCSFNFWAYKNLEGAIGPEHTTSCGHQTGLTVMMSPIRDNYNLSLHKFVGYEVFIHDTMDIPNEYTQKQMIVAGTETAISVTPLSAYGTSYLRSKSIRLRRCYFPKEYKLVNFNFYSLPNCLAECRSRLMHAKCHCVPLFWPKLSRMWVFCQSASQINCSLTNRDIISEITVEYGKNSTERRLLQNFKCNCLPLCTYHQYTSMVESTPLDRNFSHDDRRIFRGIEKIGDYTLFHIFYGDLIAENFRLDVIESWLSSIGTIGGIAGLYMGFSFLSIFELIFFVFFRPLSNWLTKQQILRQKMKNRKKMLTKKVKEVKEN